MLYAIKKDLTYNIKIKSFGNGVTLPLDTEMNNELKALIKLALQNGCKWSKWNNDNKSYEPADNQHLPEV